MSMPWPTQGGSLTDDMRGEINKLCSRFGLDGELNHRLQKVMAKRTMTFEDDMRGLSDSLESALHPPGLCSAKIREMEESTGAGGGFSTNGGGSGFGSGGFSGGASFSGGAGPPCLTPSPTPYFGGFGCQGAYDAAGTARSGGGCQVRSPIETWHSVLNRMHAFSIEASKQSGHADLVGTLQSVREQVEKGLFGLLLRFPDRELHFAAVEATVVMPFLLWVLARRSCALFQRVFTGDVRLKAFAMCGLDAERHGVADVNRLAERLHKLALVNEDQGFGSSECKARDRMILAVDRNSNKLFNAGCEIILRDQQRVSSHIEELQNKVEHLLQWKRKREEAVRVAKQRRRDQLWEPGPHHPQDEQEGELRAQVAEGTLEGTTDEEPDHEYMHD